MERSKWNGACEEKRSLVTGSKTSEHQSTKLIALSWESGSTGLSSLNQSKATLASSTGIAVTKPAFQNPLNFEYPVTPYIYGQNKPSNVTDNVPLSGDIQTFGLLQTAFVADPLSPSAGGWWSQTYTTAPDVALNHPARWVLTGKGASPNCLTVGSPSGPINTCATLAPSYPTNPWLSEYHWMRRFFISNALSGAQGPQLETATVGDKLLLQARVYNYSFQSMPAGSSVHARFYVQPWNSENNTPGYRAPSILMCEEAVSIALRSSAVSLTSRTPRFSSRRSSLVVPGIGTIQVFWASNQASAT